jgi:endonuclease-3 related protein
MPEPNVQSRLLDLYRRLLDAHGPQRWWPGDRDPFVVVVGAILTQSTSWANVEWALAGLRGEGLLSPRAILTAPEERLTAAVRPSGYFNVKAQRLRGFARALEERFEGDLERLFALPLAALRSALLDIDGIGPETADDIILYAAHRPVFVIDAYTRRILSRLGLRPDADSYDRWQALFMDSLPHDTALFNEYHALLVRHGKSTCRKTPLCERCALLMVCPTGNRSPAGNATERP